MPEERELLAAGTPFADYTKTLEQRAGLRWPIALRRLAQMRHDYPAAPLIAAIETATHYGLYDLDRLERMILRNMFMRAQDLFDEMYASIADRSTRRLLNRLAKVDVLVIDEMG